MYDCARVNEERNAAQKDRKAEPERDEDGTFFDKGHQELIEMNEDAINKELLEEGF